MKIVIVTDAWYPQINGVVRTLEKIGEELGAVGHDIEYITPQRFAGVPCPTYPEIKLCCGVRRRLARLIDGFQPCAIHIATEGPLGYAARRYCLRRRLPFTTAYHTRFPEYIRARFRVPARLTYALLRRFHRPSARIMVATDSLHAELTRHGFRNLVTWSRGVDVDLFRPRDKSFLDLPRPIFLYVGRVAVEKNIGAFLDLPLPGSKLVVGDGPQLAELRGRYPGVCFAGAQHGEALARHYAASDVFVFPSRTDTFGLVVLEALASGLPVAGYPVTGPMDVIGGQGVGVLSEDLGAAARAALAIAGADCRRFALGYSWRASAEQFLHNLAPLPAAEKQGRFAAAWRSKSAAIPGG
ncbi:MAG TPA: glycosyltransferase family 1 protein [Candidatus Sulfotelmatobacter sp.]|nr:glycosyltransferase family 1 protein [Candidatus Sulfotelmatobacter sp.]